MIDGIRDNLPKAFIKTGNNKCCDILDCAKVVIEKLKQLDCQSSTWSDYKYLVLYLKLLVQFQASPFFPTKKFWA